MTTQLPQFIELKLKHGRTITKNFLLNVSEIAYIYIDDDDDPESDDYDPNARTIEIHTKCNNLFFIDPKENHHFVELLKNQGITLE